MPILVSEFFPKYLQFYKLSYVILTFNIYMLDENLQFYRKFPYFFFNYILIEIVSLSLYLWKLPQKSSNFSLFLGISIILWYMLCKILQIYQKYLHFPFQLYYYFMCIPTIGSVKVTIKIFKFNVFTWISIILSEMLYKIFSFIRNCLHFLFHWYSNCICIPFILSEILLYRAILGCLAMW